ncbi:MAG: nicotinate-nucleotide--dimethylbenzimidazole phosphoribosyltransferase [Flavobacteriales bacterium]|nr:nicotinate-nucleotide--dimethylbenzimidazole phosphoribosyltransferase [Flavobacteriales bacterium]MCB9449076.1 nicotinate-nucleotide--dimethylbenzimidazole phosphoribosyltransferase [Flavobacteriales bacterium]
MTDLFDIQPVPGNLVPELQQKIDGKTKPPGALGMLEKIALQIGSIQQTLQPKLTLPNLVVFAGDHGIATTGLVNPFPQEVTAQMVYNFLNGGAAINVFCKQHNIRMQVVDAGVNHRFSEHPDLINAKLKKGTHNYLESPAMTLQECKEIMHRGANLIDRIHQTGCNVIAFGEMGIGNTSAAAILCHLFTGHDLEACTGKGTGLDEAGIDRKRKILAQAVTRHPGITDPVEILATFGGFEIAMMCGAMLQAASHRMVMIIDGFIVGAALLAASAICKEVTGYCIFAHLSEEQGHRLLLDHLEAQPILQLGMRLGEGTGAALAYPLVASAVGFLNEMASFESAAVSGKTSVS